VHDLIPDDRGAAAGSGRLQAAAVAAGEVLLWEFPLDAASPGRSDWTPILSPAEQAHAARFVREQDRERYRVAHGRLREILAGFCRCEPDALVFETGPYGKPALRPAAGPIRFNLSHSAGRAMVGVAGEEIGVDIERIDRGLDVPAIAARYFHAGERRAIESAASAERTALFFRYWTAKEAALKACGLGLSLPLDALEIRFEPHGELAAVVSHDPARLAPDWTVRCVPAAPGWAAAVCRRGRDWTVRRLPLL